jgi:hypothetical protein
MMEGLWSLLEVFIGLAFIYLLLSLLVSTLVEYAEMWLRKRGRLLYLGLLELLKNESNSNNNGLIENLYKNPLIYALYKGEPNRGGRIKRGNLPSYLPPNIFVLAFLDELNKNQQKHLSSATDITSLIEQTSLLPGKLKSSLNMVLSQVTDNDYNQAIKRLESWYTNSTDRVSGWYKKHTQWISLGISLVMVVMLNVDTLHISQALMVNSSLRTVILQSANQYISDAKNNVPNTKNTNKHEDSRQNPYQHVKELKTQLSALELPIGWNQVNWNELDIWKIGSKIIGWLLTTLAISFGAPFWFDVLNKFMSFRTAVKPKPDFTPESKQTPNTKT